MSKITEITNRAGYMLLFCPACDCAHAFFVAPHSNAKWQWNGDKQRPTITPSLLVQASETDICHSFITDGKIQFLNDCTHSMAGMTVDLPDF